MVAAPLSYMEGFTKIGDPENRPQIVASPYNKDPNKVPLVSETPPCSSSCFRGSLEGPMRRSKLLNPKSPFVVLRV